MADTGAPLPELPDRLDPERLKDLAAADLDAAAGRLAEVEQATNAAMTLYTRQLREIRSRQAEIATERRRRERADRHAARIEVRARARSGDMPTIADALEMQPSPLPEELSLRAVRAYLVTGGQVGLSYATRPGSLAFTDGRQVRNATTWGEARRLYDEGWEPGGAPGVSGVRVHLVGTRVERVVAADELVIDVAATG